ncbi:Ada metal-binding domain-containing protein [Cloacibacillus porcorum]|uniref:Ada metal-binding domain-containing protein n=1 Tax=Cloacibacillus porcorum TaxID=1197717 RepID=UPI0026717FB1|nr:Ada metal-binding domain-containing protein [Cloacibacillus porcorum]
MKKRIKYFAFFVLSLMLFTTAIAVASPMHPVSASDNTIVYVTRTGSKYHRDGCGSLSRSKIEITLKDAKAEGYTPCKRCNPPR